MKSSGGIPAPGAMLWLTGCAAFDPLSYLGRLVSTEAVQRRLFDLLHRRTAPEYADSREMLL
jgi:hypothetical protein